MNEYVCEKECVHSEAVEQVKAKLRTKEDYDGLAMLFKMFGDGTRVEILHSLEMHEMCVCDLAQTLGMTKSAISHQLKTLKLANLVKSRREGQNIFYSLADSHVRDILDIGFEHLHE